MPKLGKRASKKARATRMHLEMGKFKRGTLHSGSKRGPKVTNHKQALAIALSEAGMQRRGKKKSARRKRRAGSRR